LNTCSGGKIIAYCDGASHGSPGPAGAGVHLECPYNNGVVTMSWPLGLQSSAEAEYEAIILALRVAHALSAYQLEIRTDHESLVEQLQGTLGPRSEVLYRLWVVATGLIKKFPAEVQIVWEPRAGIDNCHANELAGQAAGSNPERVYAQLRENRRNGLAHARSKG